MELYFKATSLILVTVILCLFLGDWKKDIAFLLGIAACCIAAAAAISYLEPVLSFLNGLEIGGYFQSGMLQILLKAVGITLISEIACMVCSDAGNQSLSKILYLLSSGAVLYLSIPIFQSVFTILTEILEEL